MKNLLIFLMILSSSSASSVIVESICGTTFSHIENKTLVTYNPKTKTLHKNKYYIENAQFVKSEGMAFKPKNALPQGLFEAQKYRKTMKEINCDSIYVKDCLKTIIPTKLYFINDYKEKIYILPQEKSDIFEALKLL